MERPLKMKTGLEGIAKDSLPKEEISKWGDLWNGEGCGWGA